MRILISNNRYTQDIGLVTLLYKHFLTQMAEIGGRPSVIHTKMCNFLV